MLCPILCGIERKDKRRKSEQEKRRQSETLRLRVCTNGKQEIFWKHEELNTVTYQSSSRPQKILLEIALLLPRGHKKLTQRKVVVSKSK